MLAMDATISAASALCGYSSSSLGRRHLGILSPKASNTSKKFMLNTRLHCGGKLLRNHVGVSKSQREPQNGFEDLDTGFSEVRSTLMVVGLDFQITPLEVLERLFISYSKLPHAAGELSSLSYVQEAAVLNIFDRFEIYVFSRMNGIVTDELISWIAEKSGCDMHLLHEYCYIFQGSKAARHLFEVAAGSYSLVSVTQILAEMEEVTKVLKAVKCFGRVTSALFEQAICFGKLLRSQTEMGDDDSFSLGSAGVGLALTKLPTSESPIKVLVVGSGMMGRTVIKHLVAKGFNTITVIDRNESTLAVVRNEVKGAEIIYKPIEEMVSCINEADAVFGCIGSEKAVILEEHLNSMTAASNSGTMKKCIFDIAIPRNVDDGVYKLPLVQVFNARDIAMEVVAQNYKDRRREKIKEMLAAVDIDKHIFEFQSWMNSLAPSETLKLLACLESTRGSVLEKNVLEMGDVMPKHVKNAMVDLSMDLRDRFFRGTIDLLIRHSGEENLAEAVDHIFGGVTDQE